MLVLCFLGAALYCRCVDIEQPEDDNRSMHEQNIGKIYAVKAVLRSSKGTTKTYSGYQFQFGDDVFAGLWRDLADENEPTPDGHANPITPRKVFNRRDLAEISRLLPKDEPVIFSTKAIWALREECQRALPHLRTPGAQALLKEVAAAADVALQGGGQLVVYEFGSSNVARPRSEFVYTIEVRQFSGNTITSLLNVEVEPKTFSMLWRDLGVTTERWAEWEQGLRTNCVPLVVDLPQFSALASVDEGAIKYEGNSINELQAECEHALQLVHTKAVRELLQDLIKACSLALSVRAQVAVHPFGRLQHP